MSDPTFVSAACSALETLINGALAYDPASKQALAALDGRVLAVELSELKTTFYIIPHLTGVRIQSYYEGAVDTRLRGTVPALIGLLKSSRLNLKDSGVEVFGSTGLLIALQDIAMDLDLDWEEALSQLFGDVLGPQGAAALRSVGNWFQGRQKSAEQRLSEYLTEELKGSPARAELEFFYGQIDELRLAVDRLAARVQRLRNAGSENKTDED